jgi:hypothetical protein
MITTTEYFALHELVCPHVFNKFGQAAWSFFDARLLITIDTLRDRIGKPIFVNNWQSGGEFDERGLRCILCSQVKKAIAVSRLYISPHITGQAIDFDVQGLDAAEVREWIIENQNLWPYAIRLEKNTSWVHLDTRDNGEDKVYLFNP